MVYIGSFFCLVQLVNVYIIACMRKPPAHTKTCVYWQWHTEILVAISVKFISPLTIVKGTITENNGVQKETA